MENKKILIINWKFKGEEFNTESVPLKVENLEKSRLQYSKYNGPDNIGFITLINKYISEDYEILVLSHTGEIVRYKEEDIIEKDVTIKNYPKIKIREFSGGEGHPYGSLIHSGFDNYLDLIGSPLFNDGKVVTSDFTDVWDFFWNEVELSNVKKKIIDTFLPLAIDMLGLSEATNEGSKKRYSDDVKKDIEENWDSIIKTWNEIKLILGLKVDNNNEYIDFLSEEYRLTPEEKELTYFLLENEGTPGFTTDKLINLFNSITKDNGNELFLWLNRVVDLINEKLIPADVNE